MLPVHAAVLAGHRRVARQLLAAGTSLAPHDPLMGRFLHTLAAQGDVDTMRILVAAGLHVDTPDSVRVPLRIPSPALLLFRDDAGLRYAFQGFGRRIWTECGAPTTSP
jgi:ankyrin repeat protein